MLQLCYLSKPHLNLGAGCNDAVQAHLLELKCRIPFSLSTSFFVRPNISLPPLLLRTQQGGRIFDDHVYNLCCFLS
jgi:hypothetical protein